MNETKVNDSFADNDLEIEDYTINRKDRNIHGGGVAIYLHKSIQYTLRQDLNGFDLESIAVELRLPHVRPIVIVTLYRPEGPVEVFNKIEAMVSKITEEKKEFILMGDLNCNLMEDNSKTKHLVQIYDTYGMTQIIKDPTRTTSDTQTLIDHIVTNRPKNIAEGGVIPCGISDHDLIYIIRSARIPKIKKEPKVLTVRTHKNLSEASLLDDLHNLPIELILESSSNPDTLWLTWKSFFTNIINKHAPVKTIRVRGNSLPYVTAEVKHMMRTRDKLRGKANKTGSVYLRQAFQQMRNKVNYSLRKLRSDYYTRKIEENKNNLRNTWKILKSVINETSKCSSIEKIRVHNTEITNKQQISNEMNKYFSTIGQNLAKDIPDNTIGSTHMVTRSNKVFKFRKVCPSQVHDLIMKSTNGKATGLDLISNRLLKIASPVISTHLTEIFNQCIEHSTFPDDLKVGKVVPIFKSGVREDPGNYRPISILSAFARIFERLLFQQLYKYFDDNQMLADKQWGFRSLHSTIHALHKSVNNWLLNIDNGKANAVIFLDLKKAFDTVNHDILLEKLCLYGVHDNDLSLLKSYLSNRVQCCSVNGKVSSFEPITCGVPQGSILGPLLFIIYMNDLQNVAKNCEISMYADDTNVSSTLTQANDINAELVPEFTKICDWLIANKLSLNILKTEYMIIGTEQSLIQLGSIPKIKIKDCYLRRVEKTKALGLIIDDNLRWNHHIDYICSKVKRNIGVIGRTRGCIPKRSSVQLYHSLVEPYFRYGNTIWGFCDKNLIDKLQCLQNRVCRIITGTGYENADHPSLLKELGLLSIRQLINLDLGVRMFKVKEGLIPRPMCDIFQHIDAVHQYGTRSATQGNFYRIKTNKQITNSAISYSGPKLWNEIPRSIRDSGSLYTFKKRFREFLVSLETDNFLF